MSRAVELLRGSLAEAGRRLTHEREVVLDIIVRHPHRDALEIHRLARTRLPRIGVATVYRTLRVLEDIGAIESRRLGEDHSHYEVADHDHLHLVCSRCGALVDLPLPVDLHGIARATGFTIERARFEVAGLCPKCVEAERR